MQEVEMITLEDGKDYNVINKLDLNGFTYLLLANVNDDTDICIRKEVIKDGNSYIAMLSNDEELQSVIKEFAKE